MTLSSRDLLGQDELWLFLFVLGWVLLNWPMIALPARGTVLGVPAVLVYVAAIWLMIIIALYLHDRRGEG
ncbi:MAG: hypothetical protein QUS08_08185 [Methanothrix sp.]|nr:hypothetical protein [Methanothrix sp.]